MGRYLIALLVLTASIANAADDGLEVFCGNNKHQKKEISISEFGFIGNTPIRQKLVGSSIYNDYAKHRIACVVNGHEVIAEFENLEPQGRGEGGACPGSLVTLS